MIRELVGGIYFGEKVEGESTHMTYAGMIAPIPKPQVRRVAIVAFEEARKQKTKLTDIHKANVLATSRFWRKIVADVAKDYPDVPLKSTLVDNAAFQLVINRPSLTG